MEILEEVVYARICNESQKKPFKREYKMNMPQTETLKIPRRTLPGRACAAEMHMDISERHFDTSIYQHLQQNAAAGERTLI